MTEEKPHLEYRDDLWRGHFSAMAGPCEILMDIDDALLANILLELAYQEAKRIEKKFSRYRKDNIMYHINNSAGATIKVDAETGRLLDYANTCYQLSEGLFDVTSGVLREVWHFNGSNNIPSPTAVKAILPRIGWQKLQWKKSKLRLNPGMEIDFGGIGKEYAVDNTAKIIQAKLSTGVLINFGGDMVALGPMRTGEPWQIALDDPEATGTHYLRRIPLIKGAIATSGDARRFLLKENIRYGHILNPRTGWPVPDTPRSITVNAGTCLEAGMLATFAMLQGSEAEKFLQTQNIKFWCIRGKEPDD